MMATWRAILTFLAFFAIALVLCDGRHALGAGVSSLLEKRAAAQASDPVPASAKEGKKCEKPLDVVFVLDSSEKVGTENWKKIVNATIDMASEFDIKTARFAVVQYTNFPETPIKLISFKDDKSFGETLKKVFYKTGGKRTDLALNSTLGVFKAASPRLGSKVVILITGGPSADVYTDASKPPITGLDLLQQPVQQLQDAEVAVYAVGVHEGITDEKKTFGEQLKLIASESKEDHLIKVGDYSNLADVASKIAKKACIVNGGWSKWSEWSVCRHPCMVKLRTRECNNPAPESGGLNCTGSKVEQYPCGSPVECQSSTAGKPSTTASPPQQLLTTPTTTAPVANQTTLPLQNQTTPSPQNQSSLRLGQSLAPPPPTGVVSYGTPDAKVCGNGYELITLTDAQYDASSSYAEGPNDQVKQQSRIDHMPSMGKVNNTAGRGAWCADHSKAVAKDKNQYLMVDLYKPGIKVGMVETQGQSAYDNSVTKFSLSFSNDGVNWTPYGKVLTGNDDRDTRVDNHLNPAFETRFIRFIPSDWLADDICMRVAIFKCREPHLVPPKKDQPEDAWADKWANAARKSHVEKAKLIFKGQQQKKH
ncbi:coadhesin-like isoform X1 [Acropora palmata]|uniref:coadhesin-like isoform X1 n=2 Tax=Acropora palmata TaxID=6131 RepID=UPI003DA0B6A6